MIRALSTEPVNGRWLLTGLVGRGATATVYRGFDLVTERPVAVKALRASRGSAGLSRRARLEFQALSRLHHPNLVKPYDLAVSESGPLPRGSSFFTMELLEEAPLAASLPSDPQRIGRTALGLLAALGCVHVHGFVHNDVKPSNVLLDRRGREDACVKLSDLGLASRTPRSTSTPEASRLRGTLHYAAPEVLSGGRVDARSDLYSLGVLLFEAATGALPFDEHDPAAAIHWHLMSPPPRAPAVSPLSPSLARVIGRLLEARPEARYAKAREAWEDIAEAMTTSGHEPLHDEGSCEAPLTGRRAERRRLEDWLRGRAVAGGVLRLVGERETGRSRLAREVADLGRAAGWSVHSWACREGDALFSPFSHPLREAILLGWRGMNRESLPAEGEILALLGGPALWSAPGRVFEEARLPLARSLAAFLASAARQRPLLIVLDDVEWADAGSRLAIECLRTEIQRSRARVLLVITACAGVHDAVGSRIRNHGWAGPRASRRAHLPSTNEGVRGVDELRIIPLGRSSTRTLLESLPCLPFMSRAETGEIVRDSGGLPGKLVRLAHARAGRQRLLFPPLSV